uniref:Uncharacterized protein n=1 Tax=Plectus sambesii TaxID=2011161 RepID=A0A914VXI7_9BILA
MVESVEAAAKSMMWMLTTLDRTVTHITSMRRSMERLELYMLAMVGLMYALVLFSIVGGLVYYFFCRPPPRDDYRRHMSTSSMINAAKKSRASMGTPHIMKQGFREDV